MVSSFHAKTAHVPLAAMAAAAWSCVEKILQEHHLTLEPKDSKVSISTAVYIVICKEPEILVSLSGYSSLYFFLHYTRPGISCSANWISFLPQSFKLRSFTLKSVLLCIYKKFIGNKKLKILIKFWNDNLNIQSL